MVEKNYYQLLEIKYNATEDEIKKAFKIKIKEYHPDNLKKNSIVITKELIKAYKTLSNPNTRNQYNIINNIERISLEKSQDVSEFDTWLNNLMKTNKDLKKDNLNDDLNDYINSLYSELNSIKDSIQKVFKR